MKTALMIAYWFPPEGNAAVYRPLRFLRNLPRYGWRGHVVAGDTTFERYDPDLLRLVPQGTEVRRVSGLDLWQRIQRHRAERNAIGASGEAGAAASNQPDPNTSTGLRATARRIVRKAESCWYHPDMQRPWIGPATSAVTELARTVGADVVWATGPPFSAFLVARRAHRRTRIPYVLDFRTSWTVVPSPFEARRPAWAQARDRQTLRGLLRDAQAVTFFYSAEAECFWRMYRDVLDVSRIHVIPNGFDGDVEPATIPDTGTFTILYTGTLADYGFEGFLQGLSNFLHRDPSRVEQVRVEFVGELEPTLSRRVSELQLTDVVHVRPPIPHAAVAELQRRAHVLLMLERRPSHKGHELLAGAKLFNYLKAGKPILGCVPRGEAERILRGVGVTTVADASAPDAIAQALETLFRHWRASTLDIVVPDAEACRRYSGEVQASALVRALEGRPALHPFTPGVHDVPPSLHAEFAGAEWA